MNYRGTPTFTRCAKNQQGNLKLLAIHLWQTTSQLRRQLKQLAGILHSSLSMDYGCVITHVRFPTTSEIGGGGEQNLRALAVSNARSGKIECCAFLPKVTTDSLRTILHFGWPQRPQCCCIQQCVRSTIPILAGGLKILRKPPMRCLHRHNT